MASSSAMPATPVLLLTTALLLLLCGPGSVSAIIRSTGGSGSTAGARSTSATTTTTGTRATVYTSTSYGATSTTRVAAFSILPLWVFYGGYGYPSTRFYYDRYNEDSCALRNASAAAAGGSDADINPNIQNSLPDATALTVLEYNQTLFRTTGLIVDPNYCNHTRTGSSSVARSSIVLALALAAVAAWAMGGAERAWL